jgi:uncharacterized protein (DUF1800 family)
VATSRRALLRSAGFVGLTGLLAACQLQPQGSTAGTGTPAPGPFPPPRPVPPPVTSPPTTAGPAPPPTDLESVLIDKLTFGATPALVNHVATIGASAFINEQLAMTPSAAPVLSGVQSLTLNNLQRYQLVSAPNGPNADSFLPGELQQAALVRAVTSQAQLAELMALFWANHFSMYCGTDDKGVEYSAASDDRDAIRPHAMGNFSDLLVAVAQTVSMMSYLDNRASRADGTNQPNQNYARELMELHTLGAFQGYTEADVQSVAQLFSGWGVAGDLGSGTDTTFAFDPNAHYPGPITVTITDTVTGTPAVWSTPGHGASQGPAAFADGVSFLRFLAAQPNCARFLATKLTTRFLGDQPQPAVVSAAAAAYLANGTSIPASLKAIFTSTAMAASRHSKVRSPFELLAAIVRTLGATVSTTGNSSVNTWIGDFLGGLGQPLWQRKTPDGFPDHDTFWATTGAMLLRWRMAGYTTQGLATGIAVNLAPLLPNPLPATWSALVGQVASELTNVTFAPADIATLLTAIGQQASDKPTQATATAALPLLVTLVLSSPIFQLR